MGFNKKDKYRNLLILLSLMLLSACATTSGTQDTLETRVMARWNAILSEDYAGAYEFLSPGYRSSVSLAQYQRWLLLNKVRWTGAEYTKSDCLETTCTITLLINFTVHGAVPGIPSFEGTDSIEESWIRSGNEWYFVPKQ